MRQIQIRAAQITDLPQIQEIESHSFTDPYPPILFETLLIHTPEAFLVAVERGRIVGYVCTARERDDTYHLASIAVHPHHRRRNVARRLIEASLKTLRGLEAVSLKLEVRESNTAAISLYRALGFKKMKTLKRYYEDGESAEVMELNLWREC